MSNRLLHRPRFALGNRAPSGPFALNRDSWQAEGLRLWLPTGPLAGPGRVMDLAAGKHHATPVNFEAGNFVVHPWSIQVLDLNAGGASDNDYLTVAAAPNLEIGSNPFTIAARVNIRSLGLGSFIDFGRIVAKGGIVTLRFDAGSGSFGLGAGNRITLDHTTSGTVLRKAGATATELPLNADLVIVACADGTLNHAGMHIWVNGVEITYSGASQDGSGSFSSDLSSDIWIGNRFSSGDRLFDGQLWDLRLIVGKAYTAREAAALFDPATRFDLFAPADPPRIWPAAGGGILQPAGTSLETDSAGAIGISKAAAIGMAAEADSAFALGAAKARAAGMAAEADSAFALGLAKARALGLASEADSALPVATGFVVALGTAQEADSGFALAWAKARALGSAGEADSALPIVAGALVALGPAQEADSAFALGAAKARALGPASEADSAFPALRLKARVVGRAETIESALAIARAKARALGLASEADSAPAIIVVGGLAGAVPASLALGDGAQAVLVTGDGGQAVLTLGDIGDA